jgi:hypothetical protein
MDVDDSWRNDQAQLPLPCGCWSEGIQIYWWVSSGSGRSPLIKRDEAQTWPREFLSGLGLRLQTEVWGSGLLLTERARPSAAVSVRGHENSRDLSCASNRKGC